MNTIKVFDPTKTKVGSVWLIIGARNTGKSVLLKDLIYNTRHNTDFAVAMTGTMSTAKDFKEFMPHKLVYRTGYNYEAADRFLACMQAIVDADKSRKITWILDDCMFDTKVMKTATQRNVHLNGRHYNNNLFNTTQYCMIIPNAIRSNIDYVVALKETIKDNRLRLYKYFFGTFPNFRAFEKTFDQCTKNFGAMVLDRTQSSGKQADLVKSYRASMDIPAFKLGNPIFFALDEYVKLKERKDASR